jgi:hypothetical protein
MVRQVVVAAVEAEVEHDAGTRRVALPAAVEAGLGLAADQLLHGADGVHVADHGR